MASSHVRFVPSLCRSEPLRRSKGSWPRVDTPLLSPDDRGGRRNVWTPALKSAGVPHRGPYALRHTYASFAIAAGVSLFELARFMGTSVEQIDRTYGHLLPDSIDRTRSALDAFVNRLGTECAHEGDASQ
jgi:integrase